MEDIEKKKEMVLIFLEKGILLNPELIDKIPDNLDFPRIINQLSKLKAEDLAVMNKDIIAILEEGSPDFNWQGFEKSLVNLEKNKEEKIYQQFVNYAANEKTLEKQEAKKIEQTDPQNQTSMGGSSVKVLFSYREESKKRDIQDFVAYFNNRYKAIERILRTRQEMQGLVSIARIKAKKEKENISVIGIVLEKSESKKGNIMIKLEDPTGIITVVVSKNKPELFDKAKSIVNDEIIGVVGSGAGTIVFATNVLWPDIPLNRPLKKANEEVYAVFVSDFHIGSHNFLEEEFNRFIEWLNGRTGNEEQRDVASKIKYLFVIGDLVDGCGIYPDQDKDLSIKDIYDQYFACAKYLKQIPEHIRIIICPGNHDAMRISEPQPELCLDLAAPLYKLNNITMVSNPSLVNIHSSPDFPGFDVLLYHGYSFDYYVENVEELRNGGGYTRADLIMRFLLQRRHLAPSHKSTLYIPDANTDPLVIDRIPDFFATGHIHYSIASSYHNITTICCSCWQKKTAFQEKMGHNPQPARVPVVNLKTRKVKIFKFGKEQND